MIPNRLTEVNEFPGAIVDKVLLSVKSVFNSITGEEPIVLSEDLIKRPLNGIVGSISIFNHVHTLSLLLCIPRQTAISISRVFVGEELSFEGEDMGDLVGELSNILAGDIVANIEVVGFRGQSSLPASMRGSDLTLFIPKKPPSLKIKFLSTSGEFWLNLALNEL